MNLPFKPIHSVEWLEKYLKTNYYKKKYDRFMWWRSYTPRKSPLPANHSLRDRILNGDFDMGPFTFEIELVEHKLNERFLKFYDDPGRLRQEEQLDKARRKRLIEDRDKDEQKKLETLKRDFLREFKMTTKQYEREIASYRGPDLINFYYRMQDKYGTYAKRLQPVPEIR